MQKRRCRAVQFRMRRGNTDRPIPDAAANGERCSDAGGYSAHGGERLFGENDEIKIFLEKMKESLPPSASIGQEQQMLPRTCGKGASW